MKTAPKVNKKILLILLAFCVIPIAGGIARIISLACDTEVNNGNARFLGAPIPIILHIFGSSLFSLFGALQFSTAMRHRNPSFHKDLGRITILTGVISAVTGLWMTAMYSIPMALQGNLLYGVRLLVGIAMLISIVLAVSAAIRRNISTHSNWIIRAYALGQGAGMQVVFLLPWTLLVGDPSVMERDVLMTVAWLLNLTFAEWVIHKQALKIPALAEF